VPDLEVVEDSHVAEPVGTHVPLLDHAPGTQFIGHLFGSVQSSDCVVLGVGHEPPN